MYIQWVSATSYNASPTSFTPLYEMWGKNQDVVNWVPNPEVCSWDNPSEIEATRFAMWDKILTHVKYAEVFCFTSRDDPVVRQVKDYDVIFVPAHQALYLSDDLAYAQETYKDLETLVNSGITPEEHLAEEKRKLKIVYDAYIKRQEQCPCRHKST
jgi:hypothetical protein